jgi:hypothetical protein
MIKMDKSEKSNIPEISVLGFWSTNECEYGRNQYQTPMMLRSVQTMAGPTP